MSSSWQVQSEESRSLTPDDRIENPVDRVSIAFLRYAALRRKVREEDFL